MSVALNFAAQRLRHLRPFGMFRPVTDHTQARLPTTRRGTVPVVLGTAVLPAMATRTRPDASQRAFCEAPEGHIRLLAPAGCGKTQCLLLRSKHLIDHAPGRPPRIRIVTFTRAARDELKARLGPLKGQVDVTTLNAWGFRRIRDASLSPRLITTKADYHFAMLNQLQSVWQLQKHKHIRDAITASAWSKATAPRLLMDMIDALKSLGFDHKRHKDEEAFLDHWMILETQQLQWMMLEQAQQLARYGVLDEKHLSGPDGISDAGKKQMYNRFYKFWRKATEHLAREATFTIEDQKYHAFQDEQSHVDKGNYLKGAARHEHILVDEFQDINPLDIALIKAMVERNKAYLTISGDDDQAIFEWRGATPKYIISPKEFFGYEFREYFLETNYRSPANVVKHSQKLIRHNRRRVKKDVKAFSNKQAKIDLQEVSDVTEALSFVRKLVEDAIAKGESPSRVAIISRKRAQIIPYQVYFASKDIHFSAVEDLQVFLTKAFNQLLDFLEVKSYEVPKTRVIETVLKLCNLVKRYPLNKAESDKLKRYFGADRPGSMEEAIDSLSCYRGKLKGSEETSAAMAEALRAFLDEDSVSGTLEVLAKEFAGLQYDFGKAEDSVFYTDPPFFYLARYASRYGSDFKTFIEDIDKAKDTLVHVQPFDEDADNEPLAAKPVHLMTALRSKGKEFDVVVLLDVEDEIWPNKNAKTEAQLEGERRIFYVAFTRARERIVILVDGQRDRSPYISELALTG